MPHSQARKHGRCHGGRRSGRACWYLGGFNRCPGTRGRNLGRASRVAFGKDSGDSQVDLGQPEGHGGSLPRLSSTVVSHCGASRGAVLSH
ncbi:hypothetical protein TIFTF001_041225 [Ficus carica]|uniref:Uncharacterized protein n=1 Tax=Ficus carica TaxID=3494 RepID=A0AA87ZC46_FICCA|nr:hypothetical protein TIFTF001_041225 [Ficus carica]